MLKLKLTAATCVMALLLGVGTAEAALPSASQSGEAQSYLVDAQRQLAAGNLRAAEIQLKNAVRANPDDTASRLLLANVYLKLGNAPAAEAEVRLAHQHGASEASTAPVLARALLAQGKFNELFQQVQPGSRPAADESAVRVALALAHLALGEVDKAAPLLQQAEQLDPKSIDAKLAEARLFAARHDLAKAESEVDAALAEAPKRLDVLDLKAQIMAVKGDHAGALTRFGEVLAVDANNIPARVGRANILVAENKLDDAEKDIDVVLAAQPKQLQANYLKALILAKRGKYQDADGVLQNVSGEFGKFPAGLYLQGAVKYELKQYEQADSLLTKVIAREPSNANARRLLAKVALVKRDPARAISILEPAVDADSKDVQALSLTAEAYAAQGKLDKSLEFYQRAASLRPEDTAMQTKLAMLRMDTGQVSQGLASLEDLTHSTQGAKVAGPVLVLSALRAGKVSEAATAAEGLVKQNPDDKAALNLLGMVRVAQKNYPGAEKIFTDVIKRDGKFLAARRNLGAVYLMTGRLDDAEKTYQQILDVNSADTQALTTLATIAVKEKKPDQAAQFLTRAQAAAPKDPAPGIDLMRLYGSQKQWQKATQVGQDLRAKFPANTAVLDAVGQIQTASGDTAGAVATYRHVTELAPKSAPAFEAYAAAQVRAKDMLGARASLMQALAIAPGDGRVKEELVNLDYQTGGAEVALETAKSFAKDDAVLSDILSASVLERAGKQADAAALLTQAQQAHPNTQILIQLAALKRQQGKSAEAEGLLQGWLKEHDTDLPARLALADTYLGDHQFGPAQTEFERLYKAEPNNVVVLNNLSWLYQRNNDPRARDLAEKAYALAPGVPTVADTLGWILLGRGDTTAALPYLKQAAAASADNMDIQYHLAVALQRSGQSAEARTLLQRIVASKTSFDSKQDAEKLLGQLQRG